MHTLMKAAQPEHLKPGSLKVFDNQLEYPGASNTHRDAWTWLNSQFWHVDTSNRQTPSTSFDLNDVAMDYVCAEAMTGWVAYMVFSRFEL